MIMASNDQPGLPRGLLSRLLDRFLAWLIGFPSERCNFTTQALRIPISDGLLRIELAADLLQPLVNNFTKPLGTLLFRSPYGRGLPIAIIARAYAARGYQVLVVSSRGTFGSGGEFDPFRTEVQDGKCVVEWMRKQTWYTGTFATCGGSYLGYVQWALLCDPPKDLVAAVPSVSPHDFARSCWGTGALNLDIIRWADAIAHQEEPFSLWQTLRSSQSRRLKAVLESTPLAQYAEVHHDGKTPWLDTILAKSDINDSHYSPMRLERALNQAVCPILIITGWYDIFLEQSIEQYTQLKERGCNVALTVGPWTHFKSGTATQMNRHGFDWIEEHLGGSREAARTSAVQYFVTGAQEWRCDATYPPLTIPYIFYFQGGGKLSKESTSTDSDHSSFSFDPRKPTPTIGGDGLISDGGSVDDTVLADRNDVLIFDTEPLDKDMEFCGQIAVELSHTSNRPFADIFVRVSEVDRKGKSHNITEAFRRLDPNHDQNLAHELALNHRSHRFSKGTKIRVIIAGGNLPQYARNHGVENVDNRGTEMHTVEHTIHHNILTVSKLVFPIVETDLK
jgi:putative CocE/NonD family hydrolase